MTPYDTITRFLLFAGEDYYPLGGALDCVGASEHLHEPDAIKWAEQFDTSGDWKHLARVDASGLTIVRTWDRADA